MFYGDVLRVGSIFGLDGDGGINDDSNIGIFSDVSNGGQLGIRFKLIANFFISLTSTTGTRVIQTTEEEQSPSSVPMGVGVQIGHAGRNARRFEKRMQEMLKTGNAGAGHELKYRKAIWWWRHANGKTLTVDGRELSVINIGGEFAAPFPLDDLKVHGHVTTNPANGRIYDGDYDFEPRVMLNSDNELRITIRNILNEAAIKQHGPGKPFKIQYRYGDSDFD